MSEQAVFDALKYRIEVDGHGNRLYYNSAGQLHRDDGPAVEYEDGRKEWWQNGQLHRTHGPAAIWWHGTKEWHQNGKLHRTDGPAIISKTGVPSFWLNGEYMTPSEYDCAAGYVKWLARTQWYHFSV